MPILEFQHYCVLLLAASISCALMSMMRSIPKAVRYALATLAAVAAMPFVASKFSGGTDPWLLVGAMMWFPFPLAVSVLTDMTLDRVLKRPREFGDYLKGGIVAGALVIAALMGLVVSTSATTA
ncbi:hypothetical protein ACFO5Q_15535 [Kordiimonas lipolytica]|uniref:Uncharacterized protein n=1 Tax=Kordiimonas lipolytica TaxID=1662421 RepID=A0ABV8UFK6_9PROT|nr:hypothetical protein [Kordiimonas lipolytica]